MRVFRNRFFASFCRKNRIPESDLCALIRNMQLGAIDADLGGGVYKQRLRRAGQGKSGGFRTIVCFLVGSIAFLVYAFAKNERDNITREQLQQFRDLAKEVFHYDSQSLRQLLETGALEEICIASGEALHLPHS